jgi:hypothetical protein
VQRAIHDGKLNVMVRRRLVVSGSKDKRTVLHLSGYFTENSLYKSIYCAKFVVFLAAQAPATADAAPSRDREVLLAEGPGMSGQSEKAAVVPRPAGAALRRHRARAQPTPRRPRAVQVPIVSDSARPQFWCAPVYPPAPSLAVNPRKRLDPGHRVGSA